MTVLDAPVAWRVVVDLPGVGVIGQVHESDEDCARCAALCGYSAEGARGTSIEPLIYEDDDFEVHPI